MFNTTAEEFVLKETVVKICQPFKQTTILITVILF